MAVASLEVKGGMLSHYLKEYSCGHITNINFKLIPIVGV